MKINYLFPNKYKRVGWLVLIPSSIIGLLVILFDYEPDSLFFNVPAIYSDEILGESKFIGRVRNNILNEIIGVLNILSLLLVAFSKEKGEDEYISKIRLESLVWAVYVNYGILLLSFLLIYNLTFLWVMIFNMFTILIFFIVRFHWQISRINKTAKDEE